MPAAQACVLGGLMALRDFNYYECPLNATVCWVHTGWHRAKKEAANKGKPRSFSKEASSVLRCFQVMLGPLCVCQ